MSFWEYQKENIQEIIISIFEFRDNNKKFLEYFLGILVISTAWYFYEVLNFYKSFYDQVIDQTQVLGYTVGKQGLVLYPKTYGSPMIEVVSVKVSKMYYALILILYTVYFEIRYRVGF